MRCEKEHHQCCTATTQPNILPTRLIDVGLRINSGLKLCKVDQNGHKLRYLTLSHCWGNLDILKLKQENLSQLISGFEIEELPQTFRDAVQITRSLGFRYIWIDALCIIQDSVADWEKEASIMGSVYENRVCTIGALFGANSHAGCFKSRQPLEHFSYRVETNAGCAYITSPYAFWELINENGRGPKQPGRLNTTAWVVQERMVSPRTLYFSSQRIHWDCRMYSSADHDIETDFDTSGYDSREKHAFEVLRRLLRPMDFPKHRYLFYHGWSTFLNQYTEGRLTRPEDRLVALNGIVDLVQRRTRLSMKCGMWMELLPFEILWTRDFYRDKSYNIPPPHYERAPSWSWASQDGPVHVADVMFAKDPTFFINDITVERISGEEDENDSTTRESLCLCLQGPLAILARPTIFKMDNLYTLHRQVPHAPFEDDPYYMVFDPSESEITAGFTSLYFDISYLSCLLVARSSPMRPNRAHGVERLKEFLVLKERWPHLCDSHSSIPQKVDREIQKANDEVHDSFDMEGPHQHESSTEDSHDGNGSIHEDAQPRTKALRSGTIVVKNCDRMIYMYMYASMRFATRILQISRTVD